ncbi:PREDICTED: vicilin-like antimicrobial peptides 2-2 [Nelumbo nucifera]|uniref:Cupin type-1 domain-containing protein n=2 Tax=Nelumbo nucifera TaxID=4432 RepID=A0A822XGU1_NELNU|nr:PREDICTED: vicilin-like antimicrobial peptides 2-2 [Nelumbo nucifera]DAD19600.1 TPA_asm: hypothetical protein HUJ06_021063 [Nelumbo nucifera]
MAIKSKLPLCFFLLFFFLLLAALSPVYSLKLQRDNKQKEGSREEEQQQEERHKSNPYFFDEQRFSSRFKSEKGHLKILERFSTRSDLLSGLDNYRLAILKVEPNTFLIPHHWDADAVVVVVKGKATINLVHNDNRESYNLECGDVARIPAGTMVYLMNRDDNENLQIVTLFRTISTPGYVSEFFSASSEDGESFYTAFSNEILEAALNTPKDKLKRMLEEKRKGVMREASKEQIKAMSEQASSSSEGGRRWSIHKSETRGPFNLFKKRPIYSNSYGQIYEAQPNDYQQLKDLDVSVIFSNISQGAMLAPLYNTRSTRIAFVVKGNGWWEMACPHISSQSQRGREGEGDGVQYEKASSPVSPNTGFIIPLGHVFTVVASEKENLQIIVFGINAQDNKRNFVAGKEHNVMKQMDKEAKELAFDMSEEEVDEILLNNQEESFFVPGPQKQKQKQRHKHDNGGRLFSVLDSVGF